MKDETTQTGIEDDILKTYSILGLDSSKFLIQPESQILEDLRGRLYSKHFEADHVAQKITSIKLYPER